LSIIEIKIEKMQKVFDEKNLKLAFSFIKKELRGDNSLPVDPLWSPALKAVEKVEDPFIKKLSQSIDFSNYEAEAADYLYMLKDNFSLRPIAILTLVDRIIYQAILNPELTGKKIDDKLLDCCYSNRVSSVEGEFLEDYRKKREDFIVDQKEAFSDGFVFYSTIDIRSYFKNISISKLIQILEEHFKIKQKEPLKLLEKQLKKWDGSNLGIGIPQGPHASRVLSNAYLHPLDTFLNNLDNSSFRYFRYVDDLVIMTRDQKKGKEITCKISEFLQDYNLDLNSKTKTEKLEEDSRITENGFIEGYSEGADPVPSWKKLKRIKKRLLVILGAIEEDKKSSKKALGALKYYLKSSEDPNIVNNVIGILPKLPSFTWIIVRYLRSFIDDKSIFELVWAKYNNYYKNNWENFWMLKLLLSSKWALENEEVRKLIEKTVHEEKRHYSVKLIPLLFWKHHCPDQLKKDLVRKLVSKAVNPVEKANYLDLTKDDKLLKNALKESGSLEVRIVSVLSRAKKQINSRELELIFEYAKEKKSLKESNGEEYLLREVPSDFSEETGMTKKQRWRGKINRIEIFQEARIYKVLINEKVERTVRRKNVQYEKQGNKKYWDYIWERATTESSEVDSKKYTGVQSFFKSGKENPLYKKLGFEETSILEYSDGKFFAAEGVTIKKMSKKIQKSFQKRDKIK
jgi:hypothetical protein